MERRRLMIGLVLSLLPISFVYGDVYRSVDSQGHVVFSDQPSDQSKTVALPPVQTYSVPAEPETAVNSLDSHADQNLPLSYTSLLLSGVENRATLTYNQPINMMITSIPALKPEDRYMLLLDGQSIGEPQTSGEFIIPAGLARGSHTTKAVIIDPDHKVLKESDPLEFTIFQRSTLLGPNKIVTKP